MHPPEEITSPHSTPSSSVRVAGADDVALLATLLREVMAEHGLEPPTAERAASSISAALEDPGHHFLIATSAGRPVGMCALVTYFSTWRNARVCDVQDVIVTVSHRRTGVGSLLLEQAALTARDLGCVDLHLTAESWNLAAHAFYRAQGLQEKALMYFERGLEDGKTGGGTPD